MTPAQSNYVDLLTRHLQAKRDYPFMLCDEPERRVFLADMPLVAAIVELRKLTLLRERTIRDFERTF